MLLIAWQTVTSPARMRGSGVPSFFWRELVATPPAQPTDKRSSAGRCSAATRVSHLLPLVTASTVRRESCMISVDAVDVQQALGWTFYAENEVQALHGYRIRHIPVAKPQALDSENRTRSNRG
jgi:hypothetical protein